MDEEIRKKILALLDQHRIMTIATLRPDGWPQATTVGYANDGLSSRSQALAEHVSVEADHAGITAVRRILSPSLCYSTRRSCESRHQHFS